MSEQCEAVVRVGPAGWSYEDWNGIVYPRSRPQGWHALPFLAESFDTIEVNVSFYRPLAARMAASWAPKVERNPRFKFTAKLWQRFTHERDTDFTEADVRVAREGLSVLASANRLGAVLVQFPWSFKRTPENRAWLARVLDAFAEFPLALEIRHASWDRAEVYEGLAQRRVAFCNVDQPLFSNSLAPTEQVTARVGYVRLHGRNADDWFREDADRNDRYNYLYSEEELRPWIARVERIRGQADEVYVITNNHYRGQAVVNAFEIQEGLGKTDFVLPRHLVDEYPRLKRLLRTDPGASAP